MLSVLAYITGHNFVYSHQWPHHPLLDPDARQNMIDAPFQVPFHTCAGSVSLSFGPIQAANTFCMHQNGQGSDQVSDLQDQKSSTLC